LFSSIKVINQSSCNNSSTKKTNISSIKYLPGNTFRDAIII